MTFNVERMENLTADDAFALQQADAFRIVPERKRDQDVHAYGWITFKKKFGIAARVEHDLTYKHNTAHPVRPSVFQRKFDQKNGEEQTLQ